MRHLLSLVLTASFLFLSHGVQGSNLHNNDDDNLDVAPAIRMMQVIPTVTAASSASSIPDDLQCYRIILGKKHPLFDDGGKLVDQRLPVRDPAVPSAVTLSPSQPSKGLDVPALAPDQPDTRSLIEKTRQPGNITSLHFLLQTTILEWLAADPQGRHNLLQTCRYYRAFVMPILGETHFISPSLRKDLLISIIAGQTGDVALFFRDRQLQALRVLSIPDLQEAIASIYYSGALSPKTEHGKLYRSIGPKTVSHFMGGKILDLHEKALRLVPLNFSGAEGITIIDLSYNLLKILDLSQQTALQSLHLNGNKLKILDLSQQTTLKYLYISNNQLKTLNLSRLTALDSLDLSNNQLTTLSGLGGMRNLKALDLDAELCRDPSLLAVLKGLNAQRSASKICLHACSQDANDTMIMQRINLD